MSSKDEQVAEDLMRSYNHVRRFVGIRLDDADGAWVLSRPGFPSQRLGELAELLLCGTPDRRSLASAIGAREVLAVTQGSLGRGWFHYGKLQNRELVRSLIEEGVRPLRSLRGRDIDAMFGEFEAALRAAQAPAGVPRSLREWLQRLLGASGSAVADGFDAVLRKREEPERVWARKLADFLETAERVACDVGPERAELVDLWVALDELPDEATARARALVATFRDFVAGDQRHEVGTRRRLESAVRGLELSEAARRLADITERPPSAPVPEWSAGQRTQLLELGLRLCNTSCMLPDNPAGLGELVGIATMLDPERLSAIWGELLKCAEPRLRGLTWLFDRGVELSAPLLAEAIALDVLQPASEIESERNVRAYLQAVRRLRDHPIPHVNPAAEWFVEPFRSGASWEPAFVLTLLAKHHAAPQTLVATLEAVRSSGIVNLGFAAVLADWDTPRLDAPPPELERVAELLDLTSSQVERYLHWRRWTGHGETFSESILRPLKLAEAEERELAHLRTLPPTPSLEQRIASLADETQRGVRLAGACRSARKTFERALEILQQDSLEAMLDRTARDAFERMLGRRLEGKLPERVRSLMLLLGAADLDLDAYREFLEDILVARDLTEREPNQKWLATMDRRGMDTVRWLVGVDVTVDSPEGPVTFRTETDPLHILEMGSYFSTCLNLVDGSNAASTLTNAIDVNKQVLYGRRGDGAVVARKLLAVTDDAGLLGFRMYAFAEAPALEAQLASALGRFAEECHLELVSHGEPSALHDTFWYDDGPEPWRVGGSFHPPANVEPDRAAEWAYGRGFEEREAWEWGAVGWTEWNDACAARLHLHHGAPVEMRRGVWRYLAAHGCVDWIGTSGAHPWYEIEASGDVLPADADVVREWVARIRAARPGAGGWFGDAVLDIPTVLALLEPHEVASYLADHLRLARDAEQECLSEAHEPCLTDFVHRAADVLHASWMTSGPGEVDRLFTSRDRLVQRVGVALAARVRAPAIFARRLRAMFKESGPGSGVEWALARQADDASLWLLRSHFEDDWFAHLDGAPDDDEPNMREMALLNGLFRSRPDHEAIRQAVEGGRIARLSTLPFYADASAVEAVGSAMGARYYHPSHIRHIFAALPATIDRSAIFSPADSWEATTLFGADEKQWQRHIDELSARGEAEEAKKVAAWFACHRPLPP